MPTISQGCDGTHTSSIEKCLPIGFSEGQYRRAKLRLIRTTFGASIVSAFENARPPSKGTFRARSAVTVTTRISASGSSLVGVGTWSENLIGTFCALPLTGKSLMAPADSIPHNARILSMISRYVLITLAPPPYLRTAETIEKSEGSSD